MSWQTMTLSGWGHSSRVKMLACRPERVGHVRRAIAEVGREGLIAYGGGRSYGDAALNSGGRVLLTGRLDRILAFNAESGDLVVEPGVTFADLMDVFLPRGFLVPVTPGTAFATLGGAVANDVHGKNHDRVGSFGDHLLWIDLLLPCGEIVRTSPSERPELFAATIGGIGLTGIIVAIALRLVRVPSPAVAMRQRRVADLDEFLAELERHRASTTYSVGWLDCLARGRQLGRGVVQTANPAADAICREAPTISGRIPFDLPAFVLSRASSAAFNALYYRRVPKAGCDKEISYRRFLYPLDGLRDWNRLYGRRGFRQFQCVLPEGSAPNGVRALLEVVSRTNAPAFLAVLKTLGGEGMGYLSFPRRGHTLAMDFPWGAGVAELMAQLERVTLDHGGRIYLAKDASLSAKSLAAMYPKIDQFRSVLEKVDPAGRMRSDLARRLGIFEACP